MQNIKLCEAVQRLQAAILTEAEKLNKTDRGILLYTLIDFLEQADQKNQLVKHNSSFV